MFKTTVLENGLKVITCELPGIESIYCSVEVEAGFKYSPVGKEGLAHFVEHMVMNGSKKYPTGLDVTRAIKSIGGKHGAITSRETANYWFKVLGKDVNRAADIIFPLVASSLLAEKEFSGERKIILEEIAFTKDSLERKVFEKLLKLIFGNHPVAYPGAGYPETISKINYSDIKAFINQFYSAGNITIVAAGLVDHSNFVALVRKYFSKSAKQNLPQYSSFRYKPAGPQVAFLREESRQARLFFSFPNSPKTLHDFLIEDLLISILGSRDRLSARIREKERLAYDVGMQKFRVKDLSLPMITGGFTYDKVAESISSLCEELKNLKRSEVSVQELSRNKKVIEVQLLFGLETPKGWSNFTLSLNSLLGDPIEPKKFLAELGKISSSEIKDLAKRIFVPENAYLAISHRDAYPEKIKEMIVAGLS